MSGRGNSNFEFSVDVSVLGLGFCLQQEEKNLFSLFLTRSLCYFLPFSTTGCEILVITAPVDTSDVTPISYARVTLDIPSICNRDRLGVPHR